MLQSNEKEHIWSTRRAKRFHPEMLWFCFHWVFLLNALVLILSLSYHARVPAQIHNNKIGRQSKSISRLLITVCIKGSGFLRNSMFSPVGEGSSTLRAEPAYGFKKQERLKETKGIRECKSEWDVCERVFGKRRETEVLSEQDEDRVSIEKLLSNPSHSAFKDKQIAIGRKTHRRGQITSVFIVLQWNLMHIVCVLPVNELKAK